MLPAPPFCKVRLYNPAVVPAVPELGMLSEPASVIELVAVPEPIATVPATMAFKLLVVTLKLPPTTDEPATRIGWEFEQGINETVPLPALTEPCNDISLAVMEMGAFVEDKVCPEVKVKVAEQHELVTPLVPVALALSVIAPEPEVVCSPSVLPDTA